jgi:hypothetical protein
MIWENIFNIGKIIVKIIFFAGLGSYIFYSMERIIEIGMDIRFSQTSIDKSLQKLMKRK